MSRARRQHAQGQAGNGGDGEARYDHPPSSPPSACGTEWEHPNSNTEGHGGHQPRGVCCTQRVLLRNDWQEWLRCIHQAKRCNPNQK